MDMNKLDGICASLRDFMREHAYVKEVEFRCVSDERGLTTSAVVHFKDGTITRVTRTGDAPF